MTPIKAIELLKDIGAYPWGDKQLEVANVISRLEVANVIFRQSAALKLLYLELKIGSGRPYYSDEKNFTPFSTFSRMKAASIAKDGLEGNANDDIDCFIDKTETYYEGNES